ncbi:MAG: DNA repair protein RecO [Pelagibacteraceae bacterium TMED124]|nr:DNA repair protein RecO [Rickettsiales bacterium]RPG19346.1 MAG: DNA repair protein RecO [Pelagibacteraceae bacterium TMED124]|tara:strand:+ start:508 stop:1215 length:708 start_codon:yes stop_codon:yes gene_type:complete
MKINDIGFFLGNKKYGENSIMIYIFSKHNGLIKSFSRFTKKQRLSFTILDEVNFTWQSKQKDSLGYINLELEASLKKNDTFINSLIKSSASELCIKFLPLWQQNIEIYNDLEKLINNLDKNIDLIIFNYVWWEILFLKNTGYGINLDKCSVSGSKEKLYYLSPNSGNSVTYSVGHKYRNKLFKLPYCLKEKTISNNFVDYVNALKITTYFLRKNFDYDLNKFIFRTHLINKLKNL